MYTFFVGIDIGKSKHHASFINLAKDKVAKDLFFDNTGEGFQSLLSSLATLDRTQTVVGLEATGHYWLALYAFLVDQGWSVKVINPIQTDVLRKMSLRKVKTDRRDSFVIAEVLHFGRYTETVLPSEKLLQIRELSRYRAGQVEATGDLKRKILGILDRVFPEFASCFSDVFGATPMELLREYSDPETLANCDVEQLVELLEKTSKGYHSTGKANELLEKAAGSIGIKNGLPALTLELRLLLQQVAFIKGQVKELDDFIAELMEEHDILLSIPGIGVTLGAAIVGEIGDITRFSTPKQLLAFAGMDPKVTQSGNFTGTENKISKRGSPYLRRAVYLAAHAAKKNDPVFREFYDHLVVRGKHPNTALVAVGNKLLRVIHAVLTKGTPYDSSILANRENSPVSAHSPLDVS